jgi:hypothetical protein
VISGRLSAPLCANNETVQNRDNMQKARQSIAHAVDLLEFRKHDVKSNLRLLRVFISFSLLSARSRCDEHRPVGELSFVLISPSLQAADLNSGGLRYPPAMEHV